VSLDNKVRCWRRMLQRQRGFRQFCLLCCIASPYIRLLCCLLHSHDRSLSLVSGGGQEGWHVLQLQCGVYDGAGYTEFFAESTVLWIVCICTVYAKNMVAKLLVIQPIFQTHFLPLHGMQTRSCDENSVRPSVCPSDAWIVTKRQKDMFRFLYDTKDNLS